MLNRWFQRRRIKDRFGSCISPEFVDQVLSGRAGPSTFEPRDVIAQFILLRIRDDDSTHAAHERLRRIAEIAGQASGLVEQLVPLVFVTFGTVDADADNAAKSASDRLDCVERLVTQIGPDVALIHGQQRGLVGDHGSVSRARFGTLLADASLIVRRLTELKPGERVVWPAPARG